MNLLKLMSSNLWLFIGLIVTSCSTITVKTGENFEAVELPDHSIVCLNHNSSIQYDKQFEQRRVALNGEAYFSVAEGATPFVVNTSNLEIVVLGTEFNIKDTKEEVEVEVEAGEVELKSKSSDTQLKRGSRGVYSKKNKTTTKGKAKYKHRDWMIKLQIDLKQFWKDFKRGPKVLGNEAKRAGKEFKDEGKKLKLKLK